MSDRPLVVMALDVESGDLFEQQGIHVLFTGVGKVNAAYVLTRHLAGLRARGEPVPLVVNFGSAGSRTFRTGSLVGCDRFIQRDIDARGLGFELGVTPYDSSPKVLQFDPVFPGLPHGVCGSADRFETLHEHDTADVVDMEAYALAKVCHLEGVRFACAKFITDGADANAAGDWQKNVRTAAAHFVDLYGQL